MGYIAVIDAGTSSIKVLIFDESGDLILSGRASWTFSKCDEMAREFDPERVFGDVTELLSSLLREGGIGMKDLSSITITSQREGIVVIDRDGREIYCGTNLDLQALFVGYELEERMGDELYGITGHRPPFLFAPAKLLWLSREREDFKRAHKVLPISDWLVYRLSGEVASTPSGLSEIGLLNIRERKPAEDLVERIGIGGDIIPPVRREGEVVGEYRGVPIVLSGPDSLSALLPFVGMDDIGVVTGWSITSILIKGEVILDPEGRIWSGCHVKEGEWFIEGNSGDVWGAVRSIRDILFPALSPEEALSEMEKTQGKSKGTLLFLGAGPMDMKNLPVRKGGLIFEGPPHLLGIGRDDVIRAFRESIAFSIRSNIEMLEGIGGRGRRIVLLGRWARNRGFTELLSSVLNRDVEVFGGEATGLGALANTLGKIPENAKLTTKSPDPLLAEEYEELYGKWMKVFIGGGLWNG